MEPQMLRPRRRTSHFGPKPDVFPARLRKLEDFYTQDYLRYYAGDGVQLPEIEGCIIYPCKVLIWGGFFFVVVFLSQILIRSSFTHFFLSKQIHKIGSFEHNVSSKVSLTEGLWRLHPPKDPFTPPLIIFTVAEAFLLQSTLPCDSRIFLLCINLAGQY